MAMVRRVIDNGVTDPFYELLGVVTLEDIIEVTEDDTYGGKQADAIRIGPPYGTTDRILIKTKKKDYILFTTNRATILNRINS